MSTIKNPGFPAVPDNRVTTDAPADGNEYVRKDGAWAVATGGGGDPDWADITNKPSTFPPEAHTHAVADVTGLQTSLDNKAAVSHTHSISAITNLQTTLDGKAATSHSHVIGDVTGLQTALDGKQPLATVLTNTTAAFTTAQETKLASLKPVLAYVKTANETRVSSTAYTTDQHMVTGTLEANTTYDFSLLFILTGDTAQDMRFRIDRTGLADADLRFTNAVATVPSTPITWGSNTNVNLAGSSVRMVTMRGVLRTVTETGTLSVGWGQQVSGAPTEVTTMYAGSFIRLEKLT